MGGANTFILPCSLSSGDAANDNASQLVINDICRLVDDNFGDRDLDDSCPQPIVAANDNEIIGGPVINKVRAYVANGVVGKLPPVSDTLDTDIVSGAPSWLEVYLQKIRASTEQANALIRDRTDHDTLFAMERKADKGSGEEVTRYLF